MRVNKKVFTNSKELLLEVPCHKDESGNLIVVEENDFLPFRISRVFTVNAYKDSVRGEHAHIKCSQFMVCLSGSVEIICDDGFNINTYLLDGPSIGLYIPPGVWAQQTYKENVNVLNVFCDFPYDENDYIYVKNEFYRYIKSGLSK